MEGYDYNPSTGTYVRNPHYRPSHPPPLPPKEYDSVKETQTEPVELEASLSSAVSYISVDSQQPKRRKVRILSLDGGGIRGYSTLVILGELMHQVYVQENGGRAPKSPQDLPRPCDYFDLIGGNGTTTRPKSFQSRPFVSAQARQANMIRNRWFDRVDARAHAHGRRVLQVLLRFFDTLRLHHG